jgi:ribonuclease Z
LSGKFFRAAQSLKKRLWPLLLASIISLGTGLTQAQGIGGTAARVLDPDAGLSVILLGTGIPIPNPARATACTAIIAGDRLFLVDVGRNCVAPFAQAGLRDISGVFLGHFHSDHFIGLGELLLNTAIAGATASVFVHGPVGASEVIAGLTEVYRLDLGYRVAHHGEKFSAATMLPEVTERQPGMVFEDNGLKVTMFNVCHPPIEPAVGYRFGYQGKSVVVSGDTRVCPAYAEASRGADFLVSEAVSTQMLQVALAVARNSNNTRQYEMPREGIEYHADTLELARMVQDVGVKKLALTHLMPSIAPTDAMEATFIQGMHEIYRGTLVVGRDGMEVSLD